MREIKNATDYNTIVEQNKPVLLDFYADWCGPCQVLLPTVEALAEDYADEVIVAKINVDQHPELANQFGVRSIPALFVLKDQQVVNQLTGIQTKQALSQLLDQQLALA